MGAEGNPFEVVIMLEPFHRLNIKAGNFDVSMMFGVSIMFWVFEESLYVYGLLLRYYIESL